MPTAERWRHLYLTASLAKTLCGIGKFSALLLVNVHGCKLPSRRPDITQGKCAATLECPEQHRLGGAISVCVK